MFPVHPGFKHALAHEIGMPSRPFAGDIEQIEVESWAHFPAQRGFGVVEVISTLDDRAYDVRHLQHLIGVEEKVG